MRIFYVAFCAVSLARLPVQAATITKMLPLDALTAMDIPTDSPVETRQIHSADFSSNIPSSSNSVDVQEMPIPVSPSTSIPAKTGHRSSAKFSKRDSESPLSFFSNSASHSQALYASHLPESKSLSVLKRFIVNDIVEKMPLPARDVSLPSGVNSHTVDPNSIPNYIGLETPRSAQSVIEQQHALSKMVSRGIELPEFIRPHSINFAAHSDGDSGNEGSEEDDTTANENDNGDDHSEEDLEEDEQGGLDNDDDPDGSSEEQSEDGDGNDQDDGSEEER